jgi:ectoine hydroxylase-related dioxygenase (phytanoyl-CoA dioxygenase family)
MPVEPTLDIRDYYGGLGKANLLHRDYVTEPGQYKREGYMVAREAVPMQLIREANIADMKLKFMACPQIRQVFNDGPVEEADDEIPRRLQLVTKDNKVYNADMFSDAQKALLRFCEEKVRKLAAKLLGQEERKMKTIESVLFSEDDLSDPQDPHRDLPKRYADSSVCAFLCIEPGSTFLMARATHKENEKKVTRRYMSRYRIHVGDILFFHPRLIHAGDSYARSNMRLHYYVMPNSSRWKINETYLLTEREKELVSSNLHHFTRNRAAVKAKRIVIRPLQRRDESL